VAIYTAGGAGAEAALKVGALRRCGRRGFNSVVINKKDLFMAKVKVKIQQVSVVGNDGKFPFVEALARVRTLQLPVKTFYWLNKISLALNAEVQAYEEARQMLVKRLGVKVATAGAERFEVPKEKIEAFVAEIKTLDKDIELPIDEGNKLELPATGIADDWILLMHAMDIFAEPK
jgi:hypothetical protein